MNTTKWAFLAELWPFRNGLAKEVCPLSTLHSVSRSSSSNQCTVRPSSYQIMPAHDYILNEEESGAKACASLVSERPRRCSTKTPSWLIGRFLHTPVFLLRSVKTIDSTFPQSQALGYLKVHSDQPMLLRQTVIDTYIEIGCMSSEFSFKGGSSSWVCTRLTNQLTDMQSPSLSKLGSV